MLKNNTPQTDTVSNLALKWRQETDSYSSAQAKALLQKVRKDLKDSKKEGDSKKAAWSLVRIAMVLRGQRQYQMALQFLDEARAAFGLQKDNIGLANVFYELSFANREVDRLALGLEYGRLAIKMFQEHGRTEALAWAFDNFSVVHHLLNNHNESLIYAKKARAFFLEYKSDTGLAWNACNFGAQYLDLGYFSDAEKFYSEGLKKFEGLDHKQGIAWGSMGLAVVYKAQYRFDLAEDCLKKAISIYKEFELKDKEGACLLHQAAIRRLVGKDEDALLLNKRAVQLLGPLKNNSDLAWGLFQMGQIFRDRGQLIRSWQSLREAHNYHTDVSNRKGMGWAENEWGQTYLELSNLSHARESFIRAKVIADQIDSRPLKAEGGKNFARLHLDEGLLQKAASLLDETVGLSSKYKFRETEAEAYLERARYFLIIGEPQKARFWINAADTLVEKNDLHRLKGQVGIYLGQILAAEKKFESSELVLNDVLRLAKKHQQRNIRALALLGIIQENIRKKAFSELSPLFAQLEKDVRILSSRKLKAKFLLVKGWAASQADKEMDSKLFEQPIQILASNGLLVLETQFQTFLRDIYREAGQQKEQNGCQNDIKTLLDKGPVDLHLVRPTKEVHEFMPVSLTA